MAEMSLRSMTSKKGKAGLTRIAFIADVRGEGAPIMRGLHLWAVADVNLAVDISEVSDATDERPLRVQCHTDVDAETLEQLGDLSSCWTPVAISALQPALGLGGAA